MEYKVDCDNEYEYRLCRNGQICIEPPDFPHPGTYRTCTKCNGSGVIIVDDKYIEKQINQLEKRKNKLISNFIDDLSDIRNDITYWRELVPQQD